MNSSQLLCFVSCSSFVFLSEYQRCKSKYFLPVGSVTDELDVLEVFLSGCFGFSLRWSCWDGRYLTLKHTESTFMINTEMETIIAVCTENHFMCYRWTVLIDACVLTSTESSVSGVSGFPLS